MTSSHPGTLLHLDPGCNPPLCPAIDITVPGYGLCSLSSDHHGQHEMRCDDTEELLAAWPAITGVTAAPQPSPHAVADAA